MLFWGKEDQRGYVIIHLIPLLDNGLRKKHIILEVY